MAALLRLALSPLVRCLKVGPSAGRRLAGAARVGLAALALTGGGCAGEGIGQVSGTLFVRGCTAFDPTTPGSREVPSPVPSYAMDPSYFFAEIQLAARRIPADDPPAITRMRIRVQKSSHRAERADSFQLFIYDLDGLASRQASLMALGAPGMPIIPPPLNVDPLPPPPDPASTVRASLVLNGTCDYPVVAPQLRGFVHFTEIGTYPGQVMAGEFSVTVEDHRAQREQGPAPQSPDIAGALTGSFRFPIRTGPGTGSI